MPELYSVGSSTYQKSAQPYLDAIACGVRDDPVARKYLLEGTAFADRYGDATLLWKEQWERRDPQDKMAAPFWANYWYEPCATCDCRIEKSVSMEIDAMFFFRNVAGETLAVHIEMKRDRESLSLGQAQAYRPRAACYRDGRRARAAVLEHDHFMTVLFCGLGTRVDEVGAYFDRVVLHSAARHIFGGYPIG